jgi:hypothetical protein
MSRSTVRMRRSAAGVGLAVATLVGAISTPAMASENYNGKSASTTGCDNDARTIYSVTLSNVYNRAQKFPGTVVQLRYSAHCRTAWGRLIGASPALPGNQAGCYVSVIRSDGRRYDRHEPPNASTLYTPMVNDAGYTSYAYAYCDSGAWEFHEGTAKY